METLTDWLAQVKTIGQLKTLEGADWDLEIGCITNLNARQENCPALLFDRIKDHPPGYRLVTSALTTPGRLALTLGFSHTLSNAGLVQTLRQKLPVWEASQGKYPAVTVQKGAVLENVQRGNEVNLFQFPAPKWNEGDGGRYIGTGGPVITQDPDTGRVNLGAYRVQVHEKNLTALHISPSKHGRMHIEKYHGQGRRAPVAISLGQHPLIFAASGVEVPHGNSSEYDYIGAIRGKPVEVIKEEVTGLPVPADAELVIAGWCPADKKRAEGPFGEFTGYYAPRATDEYVLEVERVYHRTNPVLLGAPPGKAPSDYSNYINIIRSAMLHNELEREGIPDIRGVWFDVTGQQQWITVSIRQKYAGHAKQVAVLAGQSRLVPVGRYVIVVDDDIDPTNRKDVMWALCTRSDPEKSIDIVRHAWSSPLDTTIRKPASAFFNTRAIIDACKPYEWMNEFPKEIKIEPDLIDRVRKKWPEIVG